ncbi:benzoate/H(+) symporter BenE family transporter [Phyllobacterium trifolii]|nr:benzoate/H(+) symporter BenE family transporter [Phyllobacterium trifolii]
MFVRTGRLEQGGALCRDGRQLRALCSAFGLLAGAAVPIALSLPSVLIGTVAGLAMIGVLLSAFQNAFGKSLGNQTGAFVALAVAMSNVSLVGISAPFWALGAGVIVSTLVEAGTLSEKQVA